MNSDIEQPFRIEDLATTKLSIPPFGCSRPPSHPKHIGPISDSVAKRVDRVRVPHPDWADRRVFLSSLPDPPLLRWSGSCCVIHVAGTRRFRQIGAARQALRT